MIAFIPSTKRSNKQTSYNYIHDLIKTYIVVPEEEYNMYQQNYPGDILPCPVKGIAPTRDWIIEHCISYGIDKFIQFDDDITPQTRREDGKISNSSPEEVKEALTWLEHQLNFFAHASWSVRALDFDTPGNEKTSGRMMHVLAYRTDVLKNEDYRFCNGVDKTHVQDDFNMTLQLLTGGYDNIISLYYRSNPSMSNSKGGASSWRTLEIHNNSAKRMKELFPEFVRLREKKNWQGMEGEVQYDITVQWKKAFQSGLKKRELCSQ